MREPITGELTHEIPTIAILLSVIALPAGWAINGDTGIVDFLTLLGGWGACR